MTESRLSTAQTIENLSENEKYKKFIENGEKHGQNSNDCVQEKNLCCETCDTIQERANENDEIKDISGIVKPSISSENNNPPLNRRSTVGNFTIARYSPSEWQKSNDRHVNDSKFQIREAKNLDYKEKLMESEFCSLIDKKQFSNTLLLTQRARELFHWKAELVHVGKELEIEIEKIQKEIQRLLKASQAVEMIRKVDKDIQQVRSTRMQHELIHDIVTEEIIKEDELCNDILNLYCRCLDETRKMLEELKDSKQRLEYDWSDKNQAYIIDTTCIGLRNESENLEWKPGSIRLPQDQSSLDNWTIFVKDSIILAKTAMNGSEVLRLNMKETTNKSVTDLRKQAAAVELAITDHINTLVVACRNLEQSLKDCLKRLSDNERLINRTNCAVKRLDGPMKCAQTRLASRLSRENVENCKDQSQCGLICEVKIISESTSALAGQAKSAQDSTDTLKELRKKLESNLMAKKKILHINQERCQFMRIYYPSITALSGY